MKIVLMLLLMSFFTVANANSGFGGGGAGGSWEQPQKCYSIWGEDGIFSSLDSACKSWFTKSGIGSNNPGLSVGASGMSCVYYGGRNNYNGNATGKVGREIDCQTCEENQYFNETLQQCIDKEPDCPEGYIFQNGQCVKKDEGGDDCDPKIQQCDDNKPKCDICAKLDKIISNQGQQIAIAERQSQSLADILSQQRQTNQSLNSVAQKIDSTNQRLDTTNNNLNNINRNINNTNQKLDNTNTKLDTISSDTKQTNQKLDNIASKTDEQTGVLATIRDTLKDIKDLLNTKQENSTEPTITPDNETLPTFDPFSAVRGFDISQNRINASKQCPTDKTFQIMGATFSLPMSYLCDFLANLAPIFLALAYFKGGMIIIRGLE